MGSPNEAAGEFIIPLLDIPRNGDKKPLNGIGQLWRLFRKGTPSSGEIPNQQLALAVVTDISLGTPAETTTRSRSASLSKRRHNCCPFSGVLSPFRVRNPHDRVDEIANQQLALAAVTDISWHPCRNHHEITLGIPFRKDVIIVGPIQWRLISISRNVEEGE
ncbi:hypothetical protein CEXT_47931 [Caerostris extrusa]|uniref:Uncharacterized protein n=1 Tax=Caerostris extrusa TaxID=172846 RepID=A0AAV4TE15_CAEEX|nr:hypothetical protein CEXT_47931 [Caerostris extrusa]